MIPRSASQNRATIVVGIDGGGTHTRAVAVGTTGRVLASAFGGAASPNKTPHAQENIRQVIQDVAAQAQQSLSNVSALVAGLAGLDAPEDQLWAMRFTDLPGLLCPRLLVNDAVIAHAGALGSLPGIIAISGTGSNVYGVTEEGRRVTNSDFQHYAPTAARHLAFSAVHGLLAGRASAEDQEFAADILAFWKAKDVPALRAIGAQGFVSEGFERNRRFAEMAPLVTAAALSAPLARAICDRAADTLAQGIELVGGCFTGPEVRVALIGGVTQSLYMRQAVARTLAHSAGQQYQVTEPLLSCAAGAALMALELAGVPISSSVTEALAASTDRIKDTDDT